MHPLEVLGDPVRRRLVEVLAIGPQPAGVLVEVVGGQFGITQPAVSRHLRILRDAGFAAVSAEGARRIYALDSSGLDAVADWLARVNTPATQPLDALHTEIARGRRAARSGPAVGDALTEEAS